MNSNKLEIEIHRPIPAPIVKSVSKIIAPKKIEEVEKQPEVPILEEKPELLTEVIPQQMSEVPVKVNFWTKLRKFLTLKWKF